MINEFIKHEKSARSIPDLCIRQSSFAIYFEKKLNDWLYYSQSDKHLSSPSKTKAITKIMFLLFDEDISKNIKSAQYLARELNNIQWAECSKIHGL